MWQDLRLAARGLVRDPWFTASAVLALALGIAATTSLFAVVYGVLLRPLPYRDPGRLVTILHGPSVSAPVSPADYLDFRRDTTSYTGMGAAQAWGANLSAGGRTERVPAMQVTGGLFDVLGVPATLGRTLSERDERGAGEHVVVISDALWTSRLGRDPGAIGRLLDLNGERYAIVGVMPPSFRFAPFWQTGAELWVPLSLADRQTDRGGRSLRVFARLRDGVELATARAELQAITTRLSRDFPDTDTALATGAVPLSDKAVADVRPTLLAIFGLASGVLLIGCANVATMLLARAVGRRSEWAVRVALGAEAWRLARFQCAEALTLAVVAIAAALPLAAVATAALLRVVPAASLPPSADVRFSPEVFAFAAFAGLLATLAAAVLPVWRVAAQAPGDVTRDQGRTLAGSRTTGRARASLIGAEIAVAFVLLSAAGLLGRTLVNLHRVDPGFRAAGAVATTISLAGSSHEPPARRAAFFDSLMEGLAAHPAVARVSAINHLPLAGDLWQLEYRLDGQPPVAPGQEQAAAYRIVMPGYFSTMGQGLLAGRDFSHADRADTLPVAVVNEALARRHWPGGSPIGARVHFGLRNVGPTLVTVVGVVKDTHQRDLTGTIADEIYLPLAQQTGGTRFSMTIVARARGSEAAALAAVREGAWAVDRQAAVYDALTLDEVLADEMWRETLAARLAAVFAFIALVLAAVGIQGVVRYAVARRTREFGVRLALGASPASVKRLAIADAARPVFAGLAAGVLVTAAGTRVLATLLYGVTTGDPVAPMLAGTVLVAAAALAAWRPAVLAARVDPMAALRDQ